MKLVYTFSVLKAVVTATARRIGSVGVPLEQHGLTPRRRSRPSSQAVVCLCPHRCWSGARGFTCEFKRPAHRRESATGSSYKSAFFSPL